MPIAARLCLTDCTPPPCALIHAAMSDERAPIRQHPSRRIRRWLAVPALIALAGTCAWYAASEAVGFIEARTGQQVRAALDDAGYHWAQATTDGLRVTLRGIAPSEAERLRAILITGDAMPPGRIIDRFTTARQQTGNIPPYTIELLLNTDETSLMGLVPADIDRKMLRRVLGRRDGAEITDLLTTADYPAPAGWAKAVEFGLDAALVAKQAKITIRPAEITFAAIAADAQEKARIEQQVLEARPDGVALSMDVRAPLPVIAPFSLQAELDADGLRLQSCAADNVESRDAILAALARVRAGADPDSDQAAGSRLDMDCPLGIGAPDAAWGDAAVLAIDALGRLGAGNLTLTDDMVDLDVPTGVAAADFDAATARLEADLPPPFRLHASRAEPRSIAIPIIEFSADRAEAGAPVRLDGRITNDQMRMAVETVARARLGAVDSALQSDEDTPGGWTVRVIAGVEALSMLTTGRVVVTPGLIQVEGVSGDPDTAGEMIAALSDRLGPGQRYAIRVDYDRRLDLSLGLPDGDECVARLNAVLDGADLRFAPGGAEFEGETEAILDQLRTAMQDCEEYRIEIGGHTDSQGSDEFNQQLSQKRAEAVRDAMGAAEIPVTHLVARGHGSAQPVATNETEAGREQNRRIEMQLIDPEPVTIPRPRRGALLTGLTGASETTAPEDQTQVPRNRIEPGTGAIADMPDRVADEAGLTKGDNAKPAATGAPAPDAAPGDDMPDKDAPPGDDRDESGDELPDQTASTGDTTTGDDAPNDSAADGSAPDDSAPDDSANDTDATRPEGFDETGGIEDGDNIPDAQGARPPSPPSD